MDNTEGKLEKKPKKKSRPIRLWHAEPSLYTNRVEESKAHFLEGRSWLIGDHRLPNDILSPITPRL